MDKHVSLELGVVEECGVALLLDALRLAARLGRERVSVIAKCVIANPELDAIHALEQVCKCLRKKCLFLKWANL